MRSFRLRPPKTPRLVENDVERQCLDALRWRHYRPERLHAGLFKTVDGRFISGHDKGTPDYVVTHALYPAFYMEVKRPGEEPTRDQQQEHARLRLDDLAVVWVDGYEALMLWLAQHQRKTRERWKTELEKPC